MATPEETRQAAAAAKLAEKGQEALNKELEKYNELQEKAKKLGLGLLDIDKQRAENQTARLKKEDLAINAAKKLTIARQELSKAQNTADKEFYANQAKMYEAALFTHEIELKQLEKKQKVLNDINNTEKEYGKEVKKNLDEANKKTNTLSNALAKFASKLPVVGPSLKKAFEMKDSIAGLGTSISKAGNMIGGKFGKVLQSTGTSIGTLATKITGGALAVIALGIAIASLALKFDNLSKEIGRATGFGDKFNQTLNRGYRQTMMSGVSMDEFAGSITSLANNFSGFNPTAEKTNQYLAATTSQLTKLGVSADSSSKLMDHFHRAMGVSQEMAADMTAQLVMMGREIGITVAKMANDFQASAGRLAIYGKNNIKVFKQLAAQAKATGLEMSTLLGISQKFDQFDTAADSAGQLNAVLGTQLSTLELMNATDAERVRMIKEQVQASVGNFDSLDKFTKMYVAQAMGVKDVAEAQRLLNMSQAETAANAAKMQEQADIQAELAKATAELVPMMTKLKIIGMKIFMVFSPLISAFEFLFAGLDMVYEKVASLFQGMGDLAWVGTALKTVFIAVGAAALAFGTLISWPVAGVIALAAGIGFLWDILHKPGSPSMASGLFDSIGASIGRFGMLLLGPIGAVAELAGGMSSLWDSMHKEESGGSFDIQAMAEIDTSKVAAGFNEIKSAVMELSNIKMDGFLAMHTDGSSSSFVMGSDGLIKSISEGKLIVDVKMPEMKLPEVLVKVFIGDRELKGIIKTEVQAQVGAMG